MVSDIPIKSAATLFRITEALETLGKAGVTEIAAQAGTSKSVTYKHLDTLRQLGYVRKEATLYELGLRFFEMGNSVQIRNQLYQIARPRLDNLAMTTGEQVSLTIEESGDAVVLYRTRTTEEQETKDPLNRRSRLVDSIAGKSILSYRPTAELREHIPSEYTERNFETLRSDIRRIRDRHLAIERSETEDGQNKVAVPIRNIEDYAVGAIVVSGATASLSGKRLEEDITGLVVSTAKSIEVELAA